MHLSLDGFVAGPNGEMNRIKVDEEIFDHVGKRISQTDIALYERITYDFCIFSYLSPNNIHE